MSPAAIPEPVDESWLSAWMACPLRIWRPFGIKGIFASLHGLEGWFPVFLR